MTNMHTQVLMDEGLDRGLVLSFHLTSRHYPPVGFMQPVCEAAIDAANEGDWDRRIDISDTPAEHVRYGFLVPARVIVEAYHLEPFITEEGWESLYG